MQQEEEDGLRYTDITHGITWDKSDWYLIQHEFAMIREFNQRRMSILRDRRINDFENQVGRHFNDQTSKYEPIAFTVKYDKITNTGRTAAAELITRYRSRTFDYMAIGTGKTPPEDGDWKLENEIGRESSRITGFVSPSGAVIKHVCSFSPNYPTMDYWEAAPVDTSEFSDEQYIFARVVFKPNRPLRHSQGLDFMTVHHSTLTSSGA